MDSTDASIGHHFKEVLGRSPQSEIRTCLIKDAAITLTGQSADDALRMQVTTLMTHGHVKLKLKLGPRSLITSMTKCTDSSHVDKAGVKSRLPKDSTPRTHNRM